MLTSDKHIKKICKVRSADTFKSLSVYYFSKAQQKHKPEHPEPFSKHRGGKFFFASTKCQTEIRGRCVKNNLILWDICLMYL